jgi:type IV pilus assembly protein PilB
MLVQVGLINGNHLAAALGRQRAFPGKLGSTLVSMELVKEEDVLACLSNQLRFSHVDFREIEIPESALERVPEQTARKFTVIPVAVQRRRVILAMSDPTDLDAVREIEFQVGASVQPVIATQQSITQAIDYYYGVGDPASSAEGSLDHPVNPQPVAVVDPLEQEGLDLDELDALALVRLLVMILQQKGMIGRGDLASALRQLESSKAAA